MKSLALLALSAVAVSAALPVPAEQVDSSNIAQEFQTKSLFDQFKQKHNKHYATADEETLRYTNFRNNLVRIAILNEQNGGGKTFDVTPFADMTAAEFAKHKLGFIPSTDRHYQAARMSTPVFNADRDVSNNVVQGFVNANNTIVDWRTKGAVTPVKDQGQCGSCWAFSATEQIESNWFLAKGNLPVLAPQQIVSCDKTDLGCNGGDTPTAYQYVESAGGLDTEASYPYTSGNSGSTGSCKVKTSSFAASLSGFTYATPPCSSSCTTQDETTFANNVASQGPASICVNAEAWQLYSSGVLTASACGGKAYTDLDHCVQLVGFNNGVSKPYWIVRNSWGTSWGNAGYIYLEMGTNACGVADEATFVTI